MLDQPSFFPSNPSFPPHFLCSNSVDDVGIIWIPGGASPWQDGGCGFTGIKEIYSAKYIVTVVFDLLILLLTTIGIIKMQGGSRLASLLFSQGLFYFAVTAAAK